MFFGWFYYDWTILILIPPMIFALIAQAKVNSAYKKIFASQKFKRNYCP